MNPAVSVMASGEAVPDVSRMAHEWALRRLAERYAQAVDNMRGEELAQLFTVDGAIESPAGTFRGREAIQQLPSLVRTRYSKTFHAVLNQVAAVSGDTAEAETYCLARHLFDARGSDALCYEMTIRYQDRFARVEGCWCFAYRLLIVDWTQMMAVRPGPRS